MHLQYYPRGDPSIQVWSKIYSFKTGPRSYLYRMQLSLRLLHVSIRVMTNALDPIQIHLGRRTIVGDLGLTYDTNTTMGHLFD